MHQSRYRRRQQLVLFTLLAQRWLLTPPDVSMVTGVANQVAGALFGPGAPPPPFIYYYQVELTQRSRQTDEIPYLRYGNRALAFGCTKINSYLRRRMNIIYVVRGMENFRVCMQVWPPAILQPVRMDP